MKYNKRLTGYLLIILSALCFSLMGIISSFLFKSGIKTYDLIIMQNAVQALFLGVFYFFYNFSKLKISIKDFKIIALQGLFASTPVAVFYFIAIQRTNVSIACLLLFTNPIFVTLYFTIFEKRKSSGVKIAAVIVTFIGSIFVLNITPKSFSHVDVIGIVAGILSSISYAFYNVYADKKLRNYSPGVILFYCTLVVFTLISLINISFYTRINELDFNLLKFTIPLSAIMNILPVVLLYTGIRKIGSQAASIVATGEVPLTLLLSFFILNEKLNMIQLFGSMLVIGAILTLTILKE